MREPADGPRLGMTEAVEGFYLALVADGLHRAGVLAALASGAELAAFADAQGLQLEIVERLLGYLAARTDLVDGDAETGFRVTRSPADFAFDLHMLDQYVGGYGGCLRELPRLLRGGVDGGGFVDRRRHAAAFAGIDARAGEGEVARMLHSLEVKTVLDMGCGGGQLLIALAAADPDLRGIGVEANPEAAAAARRNLVAAGLADRVEILDGDVLACAGQIDPERRNQVQALVAASVVNAYFGGGEVGPEDFLRRLGDLFPGRIMIVADYYGRLGRDAGGAAYRRTLIHDVAQLVSGQGVPPGDLDAWKRIYAAAGCGLIQPFAGHGDGVDRFIHLIQLPGAVEA